jgi:hypothetical protein
MQKPSEKTMKSLARKIVLFLLLAALFAGCSGQPAATAVTPTAEPAAADENQTTAVNPTAEDTPQGEKVTEKPAQEGTATDEEAAPQDAETPTELPTAVPVEQVTLTKQPYVSPSNAFTINFPENWNCSETGEYRVDCHNPSNTSEVLVTVTATGYELVQDNFLAMAQAELVSSYTDVKAYTEVSREESEGTLISEATWRVGDVYWHSIDRFVRSGAAVYHFTFASLQDQLESYRPIFNEMLQKVVLNSTAMSGAPLYAFRKEYTSREQIFTLEVPTSWSKFADAASIDRTVVEGFTSPDGRAGVQVAIFSKGSNISQETKGVKTLEIMRVLYGWDMRVSTDKSLQDGRERLEWYGEMKDVQGITYFDSSGTSLYIFSVVWEPATQDLYLPVLQEVIDSFAYKTFE